MVRTEVDYSQTSVTKVTSNILRFSVHRLKVWTTVKYHYTVVKRYLFSLRIFLLLCHFQLIAKQRLIIFLKPTECCS